MTSLWKELNRRNVVRVGVAYVIAAWISLQVIEYFVNVTEAPNWILQLLTLLAGMGLLGVLVFAWVYEMTPEGLRRDKDVDPSQSITAETGAKLNRVIIGLLVVLIAVIGIQYVVTPIPQETSSPIAGAAASIAVLPFEDYSEAKDQEYFSKGIAEEILNLLAKTNALRVAARTSSFAFADSDTDIREIGRKLDVATVLEGSIRKAGPKIRITAQLIDVDNGYHLWSETYDRDYTDIFKIQDEIAASIIDSLRVHLLGEEAKSMVSERASNVDAYSAYLIGKERMSLRTTEDIEAAKRKFEEAIAIDPDFAPAHAQLAHAAILLGEWQYGGQDKTNEEVDAIVTPHLDKALALAPNLPEAVAIKGLQHLKRFRYAEAELAFDKAIELNPNYALAYSWRAESDFLQGHFQQMLAGREKAYELDPMSLEISASLAFDYRSFGRPEDAQRIIDRMFDLHPKHKLAYEAALQNLDAHGREADTLLMADNALADYPDDENFKDWKAWILLEIGANEEARAVGFDTATAMSYMLEGKFTEAKKIYDRRHKDDEENIWALYDLASYYQIHGLESEKGQFKQTVDDLLAVTDKRGFPWRERCNTALIPLLRDVGYEKEANEILSICRDWFESRLEAGYFCPCTWGNLVQFTLLDGNYELGMQRALQWLDDGDSAAYVKLPNTPIDLLKEHPKYSEFMRRNAEEMARERERYVSLRSQPDQKPN